MSLKIGQEEKADYGRVDDGSYLARLVQVIDFGKQEVEDFTTKEVSVKSRVWLVFELPTETIEVKGEQRPRWYGKEYTVSFHEKAGLSGVVKALDPKGKAESLGELLVSPCMVGIGSTNSGKPKITTVTGAPKGVPVPELVNPTTVFDMDESSVEVFNSLPKWMQERIRNAKNFDKSGIAKKLNSPSDTVAKSLEDELVRRLDTIPAYDDESPFDDTLENV